MYIRPHKRNEAPNPQTAVTVLTLILVWWKFRLQAQLSPLLARVYKKGGKE